MLMIVWIEFKINITYLVVTSYSRVQMQPFLGLGTRNKL